MCNEMLLKQIGDVRNILHNVEQRFYAIGRISAEKKGHDFLNDAERHEYFVSERAYSKLNRKIQLLISHFYLTYPYIERW